MDWNFISKLREPGVTSVLVVSLAGINVVSSGHISQGWIVSNWPAANWLLVLSFGAIYAIVQARAVAEASAVSAAPEAESALAYRAGHPAFAFAIRLVTIFAATVLLGAIVPMIWDVIVAPAGLIVGVSHFQSENKIISYFFEFQPLGIGSIIVDASAFLVAFLATMLLLRQSRMSPTIKRLSRLALALILAAWIAPAVVLISQSPPKCSRNCSPEAFAILQGNTTAYKTVERKISNLLTKLSAHTGVAGETHGNLAGKERHKREDLEQFLNSTNTPRSGYSMRSTRKSRRNLSFESRYSLGAESLFSAPESTSPLSAFSSSLPALGIGGWIFFSFFSLGTNYAPITSTTSRRSAILRGSVYAIAIAMLLFALGWVAMNAALMPGFTHTAWSFFNSGATSIPPTTLHLFGMVHNERSLEYLSLCAIWILALLLLISTYVSYIHRSVYGIFFGYMR